jgi:F-box-like
MVSADNLHMDVLELIFAYLSGNDLVSVSLVSRSFLVAVIPKLYRRLFFSLHQSKREGVLTPFTTVRMHPQLAVHVHRIGA